MVPCINASIPVSLCPQVTIAAQCYDFIDKHIQSLDEDLRLLDNEIKGDKDKLGLGEDDSAAVRLGEGSGRAGRGAAGGRAGRASGSALASAAAADAQDKKRRGGRKRAYEEDEGQNYRRQLSFIPYNSEDPTWLTDNLIHNIKCLLRGTTCSNAS